MNNQYSIKMLVGAIVPLVIFLLASLNNYLLSIGAPCIELGDDVITQWVTNIIEYAAVLYAWWKNNNVTKRAQENQALINRLDKQEEELTSDE